MGVAWIHQHQIGRQFREPIVSIARQAIFDRDVLALEVPGPDVTESKK
jgi:hypothetical protein